MGADAIFALIVTVLVLIPLVILAVINTGLWEAEEARAIRGN